MPTTKLNKKAILAAIRADGALCDGALVNGKVPGCNHVGRCAIGAILFHNGMTNKELKIVSSASNSYFDCEEQPRDIVGKSAKKKALRKAQRIFMRLGMSGYIIDAIVTENDNFHGSDDYGVWKARARNVVAYIQDYF